jgi:hypothetical protein
VTVRAGESLQVEVVRTPCDGVRSFVTFHVDRPLVGGPLGADKLYEPSMLAPIHPEERDHFLTPFGLSVTGELDVLGGLEALQLGRYRIRVVVGAAFDGAEVAERVRKVIVAEWEATPR